MLTRHRDTRRMNDMPFNAVGPEEPGQPKAIAASLVRYREPSYPMTRSLRFKAPALQQL